MEGQNRPLWTKFICTIGPASDSPEMIEKLIKAGANVLRSNFAHCQYEEYRDRKRIVDEINARLGTTAKLQADIQGANIRVGNDIPDLGIPIEAGKEYTFYTPGGPKGEESDILINDQTLHLDVKPDEPITFMDGALEGDIIWVEGNRIGVRMINGGMLRPRKSVNVPDTELSTPIITEKDYKDIHFLLDAGVDYLALSFVGGRKEIDEVRDMIGDKPVKIISKVERKEAIRNIQEIIEASDAIMIARGDLGIELPMEEVPVLQREITARCAQEKKPVITATQMLLSMAKSLRPTRAEVSDVFNAVLAASDALMLSEETTEGIDPVNALNTMVKIARRAEDYLYHRPNYFLDL